MATTFLLKLCWKPGLLTTDDPLNIVLCLKEPKTYEDSQHSLVPSMRKRIAEQRQ